jgi:alanine dehydrogenase
MKVKEPIEKEWGCLRAGQTIFTYFHFAADEKLTRAHIASGATCIAYETVQLSHGELPLLTPMSEVAGRMAVQEGAKYLEKLFGGRGMLLGGVPGVAPANVTLVHSNRHTILDLLPTADLVIGAVLVAGAKAPRLVRREDLKLMQPGAVVVDVAVDQGGSIETVHPTTHENPTYEVDGILHYAVANMPGGVPRTSTLALTNATLPYALQLANKGWKRALRENPALLKGLNVAEGKVTYQAVSDAFGLDYHEPAAFVN